MIKYPKQILRLFKITASQYCHNSQQDYLNNQKQKDNINIIKAKQNLVKQLQREIEFEGTANQLSNIIENKLIELGLSFKDLKHNMNLMVYKKFYDYNVKIVFKIKEPQLMDDEDLIINEKKKEIEKKKQDLSSDDEELSEIEEEEQSLKRTFDFTVILSRNQINVVYECVSIDYQISIEHIIIPDNLNEYISLQKHERIIRQQYAGPDFSSLEKDFQETLVQQLNALGINQYLLQLIDHIAQNSERDLYIQWLSKISKFLSK